MIFYIGQKLTCKKTITKDQFGIKKDNECEVMVYNTRSTFTHFDYIMVFGLLGYCFHTEDKYKNNVNYIWNCFYHPGEIRKMKLKKIQNNGS